jgi:hypothetical protein
MPASVEVELDIFSGMPNPTWTLTEADADHLVKRLAALPRAPARPWEGNLGYRGFVVQVRRGAAVQSARIQSGTAHMSSPGTSLYAHDAGRGLERWLLHTGRPHLKDEVFQAAARELP